MNATDNQPKGKKMKISEIVKAGELRYTHHYMQTMHSEETCEHRIECPAALATLAKKTPDAESVTYGDGTLGIEIDGKLWAAEVPHSEFRPGKKLPHEVWHYIKLAAGDSGDTYSR